MFFILKYDYQCVSLCKKLYNQTNKEELLLIWIVYFETTVEEVTISLCGHVIIYLANNFPYQSSLSISLLLLVGTFLWAVDLTQDNV